MTNRPPVAEDDIFTTTEDALVSVTALANDSDPDGDQLTIGGFTGSTNGTVACSATSCTYTPNPGFVGTDSFSYTVSDGRGGTATATAVVTVARRNRPPSYTASPTNSSQSVHLGAVPNPLEATDPDGHPLTYSLAGGTLPPGIGITPEGSFSGATTAPGTFTATVVVSDGHGGTDTTTLTLTVTGPPAGSVSGVTFNDADGNGAQGPTEAPLADVIVTAMRGTLVIATDVTDATGSYRFTALPPGTYTLHVTPPPGYPTPTSGSDSTTFELGDGDVRPDVNFGFRDRLPSAETDAAVAPAGTAVMVPVLSNDDQGDAPGTVMVSVQPANGTVTCGAAACTYTPRAGFYGSDSFVYTVIDSDGDTSSATVTITVEAPADLHVTIIEDGPFTTRSNGTYVITASNTGPGTAAGPIVVTTTLPVGVTFLTADGSGWTCVSSAQTVTCTHGGPLAAGASLAAITVIVSVDPGAPVTVVTTQAIWSPTPDQAPGDNTSIRTTAVDAPTNLPPVISAVPTNRAQVVALGSPLVPLAVADPEGSPVTFRMVAGMLPTGVTLSSNGRFTGVASALGDFAATIRACDNRQACVDGDIAFRVTDPDGEGPPSLSLGRMADADSSSHGPATTGRLTAELPATGNSNAPLATAGLGLLLAGALLVKAEKSLARKGGA